MSDDKSYQEKINEYEVFIFNTTQNVNIDGEYYRHHECISFEKKWQVEEFLSSYLEYVNRKKEFKSYSPRVMNIFFNVENNSIIIGTYYNDWYEVECHPKAYEDGMKGCYRKGEIKIIKLSNEY